MKFLITDLKASSDKNKFPRKVIVFIYANHKKAFPRLPLNLILLLVLLCQCEKWIIVSSLAATFYMLKRCICLCHILVLDKKLFQIKFSGPLMTGIALPWSLCTRKSLKCAKLQLIWAFWYWHTLHCPHLDLRTRCRMDPVKPYSVN